MASQVAKNEKGQQSTGGAMTKMEAGAWMCIKFAEIPDNFSTCAVHVLRHLCRRVDSQSPPTLLE